ncbi:MAG: GNAT family N-acetyltransferase [Dehalococcoidia bacterium]|nr:GNAT family N-acetyltransferase [Dehalococcoidia bacterium]
MRSPHSNPLPEGEGIKEAVRPPLPLGEGRGEGSAFSIRQATTEDASVVAKLMSAFNRQVGVMGIGWGHDTAPEVSDVSPEQARRRLAAMVATERVYLADAGGQAVGIAALRLVSHLDQDVPYAEMTQIYVDPVRRASGVGALLIAHVEAEAQAAGTTAIYLLTGEDNTGAQAFYRRQGYAAHYVGFEKALTSAKSEGS